MNIDHLRDAAEKEVIKTPCPPDDLTEDMLAALESMLEFAFAYIGYRDHALHDDDPDFFDVAVIPDTDLLPEVVEELESQFGSR